MKNKTNFLNLYLIRHAKATQEYDNDFTRPLTSKGKEQIQKLNTYLENKLDYVDLVLCSPATRTRETLDNLKIQSKNINYIDEIYTATSHSLINLIQSLDNQKSVLIIGHNPSLHQLAYDLYSQGQSDKENICPLLSLPTGAFVHFTFETPFWYELNIRQSKLAQLYL